MSTVPRFIPFTQDLTRTVIEKEATDSTILIFPTDSSKAEALRLHRQHWQFEDIRFLSMNELKSFLFIPSHPIMKEEKRTLLLYQAMDEQIRTHFNISNYFQSIDLANKFFQFFEEVNDEMTDPLSILPILEKEDADLRDWQIETYQNLLRLRKAYEALLQEKGFEDTIFAHRAENLRMDILYPYKRFIFVNQFYYSRLELHISSFLENQGKEVVIYYHMPETILKQREWSLKDIPGYRTANIKLVKCCNDFGLLTSLFQMLEDHPSSQPELILDPLSSRRPYARYLSASTFGIPVNDSFCDTTVFRFWEISERLLSSVIFEPDQKKKLLPLYAIGECIFTSIVLNYFNPGKEEQTSIRYDYDQLLRNDYLYIDLDLGVLSFLDHQKIDPATIRFLQNICQFVKMLLDINSLNSFIQIVNRENGLAVRSILSQGEKDSSNLEEVLYEALGNLQAIEELGIVKDWSAFFQTGSDSMGSNILKLVLEFLKPKTIRFEHDPFEKRRIRISNLIDTRNLCYDRIAILNANEDSIPGSTQIPWLFSESQRSLLGLKTYEDIRLREKYYFFRFLLSAQTAWIFYVDNEDEDRQASSFIEELKLYMPPGMIEESSWVDNGYKAAYTSLFPSQGADLPNRNVPADFFHLKFEPTIDLIDGYYPLDYSHYAALRQNPFASYLKYHARLEELDDPDEVLLNEKMIGNIAHDFYRLCWHKMQEEGRFIDVDDLFGLWNADFLNARLSSVLDRMNDTYFKLPHNYSDRFFREILWQQLVESTEPLIMAIRSVYDFISIRPIPEQERMTDEERHFKIVWNPTDKRHGIGVKIRGRADLRLEERDGRSVIIDYKTTLNDSNLDWDQLMFYALFYYDLYDQSVSEKIKAFFYKVFAKETRDLDRRERDKLFGLFLLRMDETLTELSVNGFDLPHRKAGQDRFMDITRIDLKRMLGRS